MAYWNAALAWLLHLHMVPINFITLPLELPVPLAYY